MEEPGAGATARIARFAALARSLDAPLTMERIEALIIYEARWMLAADAWIRRTPVMGRPDLSSTLAGGSLTVSLSVPLMVDDRIWGDVQAVRYPPRDGSPTRDFTPLERASADLLAVLAGSAIAQAERPEPRDDLAFRDPATGLANGRALDDAAGDLLARIADGSIRRVIAVSAGVDPQAAGSGSGADDQGVAAVASLLIRHFSKLAGSMVARVGDGEFAVLVADHPVADVTTVAEAFCAAAAGLPTAVAVSCGLASTTGAQPWETAAHLRQAAAQAREQSRRQHLSLRADAAAR
jgi:GGDEF domain-containing protein